MYNIITSSFFQTKSCVLPGIGRLLLVTHPATTDFPNKQIKAPVQEIVFTPAAEEATVFNEFSAMSELMKKKLDEVGEVEIEGVGRFIKNDSGDTHFIPVQLDEHIQAPVTAGRVIREHSEHAMLVGDKETTNTQQLTELLHEPEPAKAKWWIWAAILGAAGLLLLAIYLYQHGVNAFGNSAQ